MAGRLLVLGLDTDPNLVYFVAKCLDHGVPITVMNIREIAQLGGWDIHVPDGTGTIWSRDKIIDLAKIDAVFWRPIDLSHYQPDRRLAHRWSELFEALTAWLSDSSPAAIVVNRANAHRHNRSKGLHEAFLLSCGFNVPESLTSADRAALREFMEGGPAVAKTCTGARADVRQVSAAAVLEYDGSRGPLHLQRLVPGFDIRVHVIGTAVIALGITTPDTDYHRTGLRAAETHRIGLPVSLRVQLEEATRLQGLAFAGWDLKLDCDGTYWCLECNPMPAFAAFDRRSDGAITDSLLEYLSVQTHQPAESSTDGP